VTRKWLLADSKWSIKDSVLMMSDLWDRMSGIEDAVRSGKMGAFHDLDQPPDFWERYIRGLANFAKIASAMIVRMVKLDTPPKRLLDVGGGHGLYSVGFAKKYPELEAEVLDLPPVVEVGRKIVEQAGFSSRVTFRPGDLLNDEWGEGYDLILIFNVIHNTQADKAPEVLKKAHDALAPGGTLALMDSEHRQHKGNLSTTGGFNELFFFMINGTRAYPEETMLKWTSQAGFKNIRTKRLKMLPEVLITGTRDLK
jgi:cyclopropane fatty-acyl-phospholipid synthase-like methyltransferase